MSTTGFRLYLDTNYDVRPWPFARGWAEALPHLPDVLPGAVTDFDIFLPDDCDNGTHTAIERQHASATTEMAVYRDGDGIVVMLRMRDAEPLPTRFAPGGDDGALLWVTADPDVDAMFYVGVNRRGEGIAQLNRGIHADRSGDQPSAETVPTGGAAAAYSFYGGWSAALRFDLAAVPGAGLAPARLRFSAGRILGDTWETIGWATAVNWCPLISQLGVLHLEPRSSGPARLHRADIEYNDETESGELLLTLAGLSEDDAVPVLVTINTIETRLTAGRGQDAPATGAALRHLIVPEDGDNAITVKVGEARSVPFGLEKWSGHRLFPRYPSSAPLPALDDLRERFAEAHLGQDRGYYGNGIWIGSVAYEAEERPQLTGREGLDHHCAFPMEAYAWACLALDRNETYLARVHEACERMLREEKPGGYFYCLHHGVESRPFLGGAFGQGSVGEALLLGYRVFGDARYLEASQRAAKAYDIYGLECNTNYMAFVLWHIAELYELTGDAHELERAVWYTRHAILRGMNPSGAHPGHNYYSAYGEITLKGMAKLLRVLPAGHEFRPLLRERTIRYTNQVLSRQRANGLFEGRNRLYRGYQHPVNGLFEVVRAMPEFAPELEPVLIRMLEARVNTLGAAKSPIGIKEIALMARYITEKSERGARLSQERETPR